MTSILIVIVGVIGVVVLLGALIPALALGAPVCLILAVAAGILLVAHLLKR